MSLERAIQIAVEVHAGACDKSGAPYILHPLRVMLSLTTEAERISGVLHDVVEDSDWTLEVLKREGFSTIVIDAIGSVKKSSKDPDYLSFVARAKQNPAGRGVKLVDLQDNLDVTRLGELADKDRNRINKYLKARALLEF
jgi:(p)ppGpp synthase/HD superfamily hydrolase